MNIEASIIIPVYENQDGLNKCLASLDKQSLLKYNKVFEVIVVDNNSIPKMKIEAKKYSFSLKILSCHKPGSYAARNVGINFVKSGIVLFLDSDCTPHEKWIEKMLYVYQHNPEIVAGGDVKFFINDNPSLSEKYQYLDGFGQEENIVKRKFSATANLCVHKKILEDVGFFDENLLSGGDCLWCWRAINKGYKVKFIPEAIVFTSARKRFFELTKQARRVAGGRYYLKKNAVLVPGSRLAFLSSKRKPLYAIMHIMGRRDYCLYDRISILVLASCLKIIQIFENLRLRVGGKAERR